ncbi:MAG TPA: hypothetical protein VGO24_11565, partial [Solirubrobacterales bacterium]|nr:hypothetical protein [Solirubrobacterales bacterium]
KEKKEPGGAGFSDQHCKVGVGSGAKFEHVPVPENLTTEGRVTNTTTGGETQVARLLSTQSGVQEELQATGTLGEATGENKKAANGEHFIEGTGTTTYTGVTVTKPAGKGCKVKGGEVKTNLLRGTSAGQGMEGKLEPAVGETFAEFTMEGCTVAALNGIYKVTGSIKCSGEGATVLCTHNATTEQGTLRLRGQKAGVEVNTTATARANNTEAFTPGGVTTVETP